MRSAKVGRGCGNKCAISRRQEGLGSSEFHRIVDLLMLYRSIPTSCWAENIDISIDFLHYDIVKHRPIPGPKIHYLNKIGSRNQYRSIEHKKISILTKSQLPNPSGRPTNAPKTFPKIRRPQPTSPRPLHLPFKIKDLGLLTYISRKSASRRFLWCNSQLLTPSGRRDMSDTVFPLPSGFQEDFHGVIFSFYLPQDVEL